MFDPLLDDDVTILVEIRGQTFKVMNVEVNDAGGMNPAFEAISVVGTIFGGHETTFTRLRQYYDPLTDRDTVIIKQQLTTTLCPPPTPFKQREIDGSAIQAGDAELVVPATVFSKEDVAAAYVLHLRN